MKRTKASSSSKNARIAAVVDELFSNPPASPDELFDRIEGLPGTELGRAIVARIADPTLGRRALIGAILLADLADTSAAEDVEDELVALVEDETRELFVRIVAFISLANTGSLAVHDLLESQRQVADAAAELTAGMRELADTERRERVRRGESRICTMKIALRGVKPPIWRRVQVAEETSLDELHDIIQIAMGWDDMHLHMFRTPIGEFSLPSDDGLLGDADESEVVVRELIEADVKKFVYDYDFGDGWEHDVIIEKVEEPDPCVPLPRCIKGKRACPIEDSGGPGGYVELLAAVADKRHRRHRELVEWAGPVDSERFDLDEVNAALEAWRSEEEQDS